MTSFAGGNRRFTAITLGVLVLGLALAAFLLTAKDKPEARPPSSPVPPLVSVLEAEPTAHILRVYSQGTVEPLRQINLVAQVGGKIDQVPDTFVDGQSLNKGDLLVGIEQADYLFNVTRAEAAVAQAKQLLAEEQGRHRQAKREWRDLGSEQANQLFLREPQLAAAVANLKSAEADLSAAHLALERTQITMPFDGRIEQTQVNLGQFVGAGTTIATVYATDQAQIRLPISQAQLSLIDMPLSGETTAKPVAVQLSATVGGRLWEWPAVIRRTEASIDRDSRVLFAIAEVDEPFKPSTNLVDSTMRPPLMPGLFVSAALEGRVVNDAVTLPAGALRSDQTILWVNSDNRLVRQPVRVWVREGDSVIVTGVPSGALVVVQQNAALVAGLAVETRLQVQ
jgi:RND family efflux transporter MFP subunit